MTINASLRVALKNNPYAIHMGQGLLGEIETYIPEDLCAGRRFYVCDTATESYTRGLADGSAVYVAPSGEATKSMAEFERVLSWLLDQKVSRCDLIFAVGGGVIGDLAGFVAASALRGLPVIQVPTTLLAMVDSSVGGKTGINMPQGKNLVGAFHQPAAVICDFDVLKTLPERELKAGYAEVLKYALLGDSDFFTWLEAHGTDVLALEPEALSYAVKRSCEMKAEIVIADERETKGRRALLNLGHTFAHAFEAVMGYDGRLLHGEAVAVGMICAMELSAKAGHLNPQKIERVVQSMAALGLKKAVSEIGLPEECDAQTLLNLMRGDKKAVQGKINFVLMQDIGSAFLSSEVSDEMVLETLKELEKE